MQIAEALKNLGLSEKEALVYIALLRIGKGSAYEVAESSGLKRPTVYIVLDELIKKGLVNRIPRIKKQLFTAKSPDEYFALAEERLNVAKQVLPELMAITEGKKAKARSFYYEGINGAREALWYHSKEMKGKELVGFYASIVGAPQELIDIFHKWNAALKKLNITVKGIVPEHTSLKHWRDSDKEYGRTVKIIPFEEYSSNIAIDIGDTFVRILAFRELQGVIIENSDIARTMRQIFDMVWKNRPEKPHGAAAE